MESQKTIEVLVQGEAFLASLNSLVSSSDYFRLMFSGHWLENDGTSKVELKGSTPSLRAARVLFDFLLTGKLHFKEDTIEEVAAAADFLQMSSAFGAMTDHISLNNWTAFYNFSLEYSCGPLKNIVLQFLSDNYRLLKNTPQFSSLLSNVEKEKTRMLPMATEKSIIAVCLHSCKESHIFLGDTNVYATSTLSIRYFRKVKNKWADLTKLPGAFNESHARVHLSSLGHVIYAIGGSRYRDSTTLTTRVLYDVAYCYDTKLDEWKCLAPPTFDIEIADMMHMRMTAAGGFVFVFGLRINYRYNPCTDQWERINPAPGYVTDQLSAPYAGLQITECRNQLLFMYESSYGDISIITYDPCDDKWLLPALLPAVRNPLWSCIMNDGETNTILIPEYKRITDVVDLTGEGLSLNVLRFDEKQARITWTDAIRDDKFDRMTSSGTMFLAMNGKVYRIAGDYTAIYDTLKYTMEYVHGDTFGCKHFSLPYYYHRMTACLVNLPKSVIV